LRLTVLLADPDRSLRGDPMRAIGVLFGVCLIFGCSDRSSPPPADAAVDMLKVDSPRLDRAAADQPIVKLDRPTGDKPTIKVDKPTGDKPTIKLDKPTGDKPISPRSNPMESTSAVPTAARSGARARAGTTAAPRH
jgi:hypothetical protein